jgi:hypothetical protein|uniref:Uncharacterized protein n=1 Tax=Myoviridae sp. ctshb19 TaxID=2825194 RepID=A0A8S5UGN0_9CAUD|nr:MAG TPA: hypothetical protein [Myoviridae sp. ctshb19]
MATETPPKYDYVISKELLEEIKQLFWIIHCDECRDDPVVEGATYEVLKALETYRKAVNGETANASCN